MSSRWEQIVVDSADPARLARWWAETLDYPIVYEDGDEIDIGPAPDTYPCLTFVRVPDRKLGKNRLHIDLRPDDQAAEVERLVDRGARRVDVGQGTDVPWVTLADPEGNEFCVLSAG